jgi:hypothetical protein
MSNRLNWNGEEVPFGMLFAQTNDQDPLVLDGHYDPDRQLFMNHNGIPIFGGTCEKTCHWTRTGPEMPPVWDCSAPDWDCD